MLFILGEAYFKAMDNPLLYFQVLMLSAQFEAVSTKTCTNTMCCCNSLVTYVQGSSFGLHGFCQTKINSNVTCVAGESSCIWSMTFRLTIFSDLLLSQTVFLGVFARYFSFYMKPCCLFFRLSNSYPASKPIVATLFILPSLFTYGNCFLFQRLFKHNYVSDAHMGYLQTSLFQIYSIRDQWHTFNSI